MKHRCSTCKKWFKRIDPFKINESWLRPEFVCRHCHRPDSAKKSYSNPGKFEREFWTCAICQQKFSDHVGILVMGVTFGEVLEK